MALSHSAIANLDLWLPSSTVTKISNAGCLYASKTKSGRSDDEVRRGDLTNPTRCGASSRTAFHAMKRGAAPGVDGMTKAPRVASRNGLKHIGGYFDRADVEKFAVLRARLGLDNSQLIKLAIDELYRKHEAKRVLGISDA